MADAMKLQVLSAPAGIAVGPGIYLTDSAVKADQCTEPHRNGLCALLVGEGPKMIVLDGKNFGSGSPKCSGVPLHLLRAAVSKVMELDADGAVLVLGGDFLFMISDGWDGQCDRQIRSEVKKKAKAAQSVCTRKGRVNFRLMFHLRELSASGHFGLRSKKTMHSQLAEPLENLHIVKGKQTIFRGDSSTRGLSNLVIRKGFL
ncbi:unnamed protein product [Symbiodinium sp. KB8]|nr:unnamed protein product [Symbiodinium sp. KB8]